MIIFITKKKLTWTGTWLLNQKSHNVTEWALPFLRRNQCHRLCMRIMDRTTPDVLSRRSIRDAWNVSRHKKGTHITLKVMMVTSWFHPVTKISEQFCYILWLLIQYTSCCVCQFLLCYKDNHLHLGMWLVSWYCSIPVYKKLFISMLWIFMCGCGLWQKWQVFLRSSLVIRLKGH